MFGYRVPAPDEAMLISGRGGGLDGAPREGGASRERRAERTVYVLSDGAGRPKAVQIKTGISDGIVTEVIEGLKEGDRVVTAELSERRSTRLGPDLLTIGVDIGGTKIAAGVVTSDGTVLASVRRDTPDLSGSADGRLWAFYPTFVPPTYMPVYHVSALDRATGAHVGPTMDPSITFDPSKPTNSWAFSFWGGDFWLFVGPQLFRYEPSTSATTRVIGDLGFMVWGAGASTCAPTSIPK